MEALRLLGNRAAVALDNARQYQRAEAAEARFRDVALSSADWVWEVDAQGRYTYCSESVVDVLGYTPGEVLGKTPFEFMPPDEAARVGQVFAGIAADRQPIMDLKNRNLTKDGDEIVLLTDGVPILDSEGYLLGYRGVDKDITERKRAQREVEERRMYLEAVMGAAPDAIVTLDARYRIVEWNSGAERLFGYSREEVLGQDIDPLITNPNTFEEAVGLTQIVMSGDDVPPRETVRYRKDGSPVDVLLAG
ncbi:MAG: PAS domain S-box protein, partial [Anaerolineae bacterium]|nr:PAS domain S-box protein [Anaerolineae bacterium]